MKKNTKKALLVAPVACLALSLGIASACAGHTHEYTEWDHDDYQHWQICQDCPDEAISEKKDHNYVDGSCECGAKKTSITLDHEGATLNVAGKSEVCFTEAMGTYKFTVEVNAGNSFTFKFGEETFTVDSDHKTFVYNVKNGAQVTLYKPDATEDKDKKSTSSGVEFTLTPAAGNTQTQAQVSVARLSQSIYEGDTELSVPQSVTDVLFVHAGMHHFIFALEKDTDAYTVEFNGNTYEVDKDHLTFDVNISANNLSNANSNDFMPFVITPKANASDTLNLFFYKEKTNVKSFDGEFVLGTASTEKYYEIFKLKNGAYEAKIPVEQAGTYEVRGTLYGVDVAVTMGTKQVGSQICRTATEPTVVDGETVDKTVKVATKFKFELAVEAADIVDGHVTVKYQFSNPAENGWSIATTVGNPADDRNEVVSDGGGEWHAYAADDDLAFKFTSKNDGIYLFTRQDSENDVYEVVAEYLSNGQIKEIDFTTTTETMTIRTINALTLGETTNVPEGEKYYGIYITEAGSYTVTLTGMLDLPGDDNWPDLFVKYTFDLSKNSDYADSATVTKTVQLEAGSVFALYLDYIEETTVGIKVTKN